MGSTHKTILPLNQVVKQQIKNAIKIGIATFSKVLFFGIFGTKFKNAIGRLIKLKTIGSYIAMKSRGFFYKKRICFSNALFIFNNRNNKIPFKPLMKVALIHT